MLGDTRRTERLSGFGWQVLDGSEADSTLRLGRRTRRLMREAIGHTDGKAPASLIALPMAAVAILAILIASVLCGEMRPTAVQIASAQAVSDQMVLAFHGVEATRR